MRKGMSLVEIMIVVAIVSILASFTLSGLSGWIKESRIKRDIRLIYRLLRYAQRKAFIEKKTCCVLFRDSSLSLECDSINSSIDLKTKVISNRSKICYKNIGFTTDIATIHYSESSSAKYDCIAVDFIMIRLGKWIDDKCEFKK